VVWIRSPLEVVLSSSTRFMQQHEAETAAYAVDVEVS
jgi:hypothetical protein